MWHGCLLRDGRLQLLEGQGVDMQHRVGARRGALAEGAGVDHQGTPHVLGEGGQARRKDQDCGGQGKGQGGRGVREGRPR